VAGRNLVDHLNRHEPEALARLRYVKIDTEGFDRAVVASLGEALNSLRPFLKCEVYKHLSGAERATFHDDLRQLGYRVFRCEETRYRGQELSRTDMGRWPHFDVFAVPEETG
jgi:hypothetical protein